jgi:hypothetical protein
LAEINEFWVDASFEFQTWGKRENAYMLGGMKVGEILEKIEED